MKFKLLDKHPEIKYLITKKDQSLGYAFSMALHTGEDEKIIMQNRAALRSHFGEQYKFYGIRQVHGDRVLVLDSTKEMDWSSLDGALEADAIVTDLPHMVLTILTADCVPILLYDPARRAIGIVHAGWKGTRDKIVQKTVETMKSRFGCNEKNILVVIGPAIDSCCYEVDLDVSKYFKEYGDSLEAGRIKGKYQLDLKNINRKQLIDQGVLDHNIEISSICTACESDEYFSYRKDRCSGRFLSAISLGGTL